MSNKAEIAVISVLVTSCVAFGVYTGLNANQANAVVKEVAVATEQSTEVNSSSGATLTEEYVKQVDELEITETTPVAKVEAWEVFSGPVDKYGNTVVV